MKLAGHIEPDAIMRQHDNLPIGKVLLEDAQNGNSIIVIEADQDIIQDKQFQAIAAGWHTGEAPAEIHSERES